MGNFLRFWLDRVKDTFERARGRAEFVAFVGFLASQPLAQRFPALKLDADTWEIVFIVFCFVFLAEVCFASPYRLHTKDRKDVQILEQKVSKLEDDTLKLFIELKPNPVNDSSGNGWIFQILIFHHHRTRTATKLRASIINFEIISEEGEREPLGIALPKSLVKGTHEENGEIPPKCSRVYDVVRITSGLSRTAFDEEVSIVNIMKDTTKTIVLDVFVSAEDAEPTTRKIKIKVPSPGMKGCPDPSYITD